jgi:xylan 1,4-beta-xylosidase
MLGHGGINTLPLPQSVVEGIKKLQPRLIRIFIQESFNIYPEHGRFDWSLLDPFMESFAETGAKIVASINIKPKPLFPVIDQTIWMPNNIEEWQTVIGAMVCRYSVERPLITYWEIGNETDIGENGGTPYLIPDPDDYMTFYQMTIKPILEVYPEAKVGGPAACWIDNEPLVGFVERCLKEHVRLDFISWHRYNNNPEQHVLGVEKAKKRLEGFEANRPEMLYTEWAPNFMVVRDGLDVHRELHNQHISVQEMSLDPYRAAVAAASIIGMLDAGLDWSFYYHIWDQCFYPESFQSFYSEHGLSLMYEHWNEIPHRFGLFGVDGEVRPYYFVYQMLTHLGPERVAAGSDDPALRVLATRDEHYASLLLVNYDLSSARDCVAQLHCQQRREMSTNHRNQMSAEHRSRSPLGNTNNQFMVIAASC